MNIAIVIVNFGSDDDTLSVVKDLENCSIPKGCLLTTYIVDNLRSKSLEEKLDKDESVIYLDSPRGNIGFAGGNNIGLKKALEDNQDIYILLNNDTQVPKNFLEKVIDSPISQDEVGVVGGLIYFSKGMEHEKGYKEEDRGKVIWYGGGILDWDNILGSHRGVNEIDEGQYQKIEETDFVTGCLFITKKKVLEKVGLLDEKYFLYHEDTDLIVRIKKAGYKIMFDPNIKIWHKVAQSSGIGSPLNDYFLTRNRLVLGFKYTKFRTKFALTREAFKKLLIGTKAQKIAIKDFITNNLGPGSWIK